MPVLVTSAHTQLGRLTVARLLASGGQVRAYVSGRTDVAALRGAGAVVAQGDALDEGHLEAAMEQVHTVVHLGPGFLATAADAIVEQAATVVTAAIGAGVRRLITLSAPGAGADAVDPLRRALGEVETLLVDAPLPTVALRVSLVDTDATRGALATLRPPTTVLERPVAPVPPDDVAAALAFLDDLRGTATEGHVVLGLAGPERQTVGDHLDRIGIGTPGAVGRLVGRVWRGPEATPLLLGALDGPWLVSDDLPDVRALMTTAP